MLRLLTVANGTCATSQGRGSTSAFGGKPDAVAEFGVLLLDQERIAVDRKIAELRAENTELKGMLADVLKRFDQATHSDVVDLSNRRTRSDAA